MTTRHRRRRASRDRHLARALGPTVENAISESVRRKPAEFADAIFPVLGPAIRKAIAETMAELVGSINRAIEHSFSVRGLKWRFEAWRTGTPYAQVVIKHALIYRVEQVFLVHKASGLLLAQASPPNRAVPDADLVSGMLTAIRDFVGDSFAQERDAGGLRTFSVDELTVIVEPGPNALLAAVVRGQAPEALLLKLQETIEAVHAQFGSALGRFAGDTAPFDDTRPLLEDCLVMVLETDSRRGASVNWRPWAIGAVLLLVAGGTLYVRSRLRWSRAMSALDSAAGLVIVQADRSWGTWTLRGLRDADAPAPNGLLAAAGADTLSLRGTAPLAWLVGVMSRTTLPTGVVMVDVSAVDAEVPDALRSLVDSIVDVRVLFEVGSAIPGAPGSDNLSGIASRVRRLANAAAAAGAALHVTLAGRTDASGTDAANQALSEQRADAVRAMLAPRATLEGLVLNATPLGTSQPIAAGDSLARARFNRSVSFVVRLVPRPAAVGASPP